MSAEQAERKDLRWWRWGFNEAGRESKGRMGWGVSQLVRLGSCPSRLRKGEQKFKAKTPTNPDYDQLSPKCTPTELAVHIHSFPSYTTVDILNYPEFMEIVTMCALTWITG